MREDPAGSGVDGLEHPLAPSPAAVGGLEQALAPWPAAVGGGAALGLAACIAVIHDPLARLLEGLGAEVPPVTRVLVTSPGTIALAILGVAAANAATAKIRAFPRALAVGLALATVLAVAGMAWVIVVPVIAVLRAATDDGIPSLRVLPIAVLAGAAGWIAASIALGRQSRLVPAAVLALLLAPAIVGTTFWAVSVEAARHEAAQQHGEPVVREAPPPAGERPSPPPAAPPAEGK